MAYEHKAGSFSLFPNDQKGNDKAPDYKGHGKDLAGNDVEVAAWEKSGSKGGTFLSCTIQSKDARRTERPAQQQTKPTRKDDDDSIPF